MDARPIGVFDSGMGGISVLAEAARLMPEEDFIFLGDNLHAPYGDRTPEAVQQLTREAVQTLIGMGCKAVMIACNTATSAAAEPLRGELSMPIVGMEPALKPAALLPGEGRILVLATAMTLRLEKFHRLMERYGENAAPVPCPGLVELVEAGETDGPRVQKRLSELLSPFLDQPVKAAVLGCTHYCFLRSALRAALPPGTPLVDGNEGTARQLQRQLTLRGLRTPDPRAEGKRAGKITFLSTAPGETIPARMRAMFAAAGAEPEAACNSETKGVQ